MVKIVNFVYTWATLLSGGLHDCRDATDPTCTGGLSAVLAWIRHYHNATSTTETNVDASWQDNHLVIPRVDYQSAFSQMHPLEWAVNRLVYRDHFGWDVYTAVTSFFLIHKDDSEISQRDLSGFFTNEIKPLYTNINLPPFISLGEYIQRIHFDVKTGLAVILLGRDNLAYMEPQIESAKTLMNYIATRNQVAGCFGRRTSYQIYLEGQNFEFENKNRNNTNDEQDQQCWLPVIIYDDSHAPYYQSFLEALVHHDNPPAMIIDIGGLHEPPMTQPIQVGPHGVWIVSYSMSARQHHQIQMTVSDSGTTIVHATLIQEELREIPDTIKDDAFSEHVQFMRHLADQAVANDPIVGKSDAMPVTRTEDSVWRYCMGGECPLGNLFTDAIRWKGDADVAFINSGGIRGIGWPAGTVRLSDVWESFPFPNNFCTGTMTGLSLFRLFNFSTSMASFASVYTPTGDRLFQVSGARITYNTRLQHSRLVSIEMWDTNKQDYVPLERLKLYKFATTSWECSGFHPVPSLLRDELVIEGEEPGLTTGLLIQEVVGDYLSALDHPYNTTMRGRLVNDTNGVALDMIETAASCVSGRYWVQEYLSCFDCPGTSLVTFAENGATFEGLISGDSTIQRGNADIVNNENFPVIVELKSKPTWIEFWYEEQFLSTDEPLQIAIDSGKSISLAFTFSGSLLEAGTAQSSVAFGVLDGGNFPGCIGNDVTFEVFVRVSPSPQVRQLGVIRFVGLGLMGLAVLLAVTATVWVHRNRENVAVKSMQPEFLTTLCSGILVVALSILPLSITDDILSKRGRDMSCMATPWLLSMGFLISTLTIHAKIWRINKVIGSAGALRRTTVRFRDSLVIFASLLLFNFVVLLVWTLLDPLRWQIRSVDGEPWSRYGSCTDIGNVGVGMLSVSVFLCVVSLVLAFIEAIKARNISDDYSESKRLGFAVYGWVQILVVGFPVLFMIESDNINARYFVTTVLIFLVPMSMLLILFVPMILQSRRNGERSKKGRVHLSGFRFESSNLPNQASTFETEQARPIRSRVNDVESVVNIEETSNHR